MSKDLTPRELRRIDKQYGFSKGNIKWNENGKEPIKLYDPESLASQKWPFLSFLGEKVLRAAQKEHLSEETLNQIEKNIKDIINNEEIGIPASNWTHQEIEEDMRITALWYLGKLDSNFYYNNVNNELFFNFILKYDKNKQDTLLIENETEIK